MYLEKAVNRSPPSLDIPHPDTSPSLSRFRSLSLSFFSGALVGHRRPCRRRPRQSMIAIPPTVAPANPAVAPANPAVAGIEIATCQIFCVYLVEIFS